MVFLPSRIHGVNTRPTISGPLRDDIECKEGCMIRPEQGTKAAHVSLIGEADAGLIRGWCSRRSTRCIWIRRPARALLPIVPDVARSDLVFVEGDECRSPCLSDSNRPAERFATLGLTSSIHSRTCCGTDFLWSTGHLSVDSK